MNFENIVHGNGTLSVPLGKSDLTFVIDLSNNSLSIEKYYGEVFCTLGKFKNVEDALIQAELITEVVDEVLAQNGLGGKYEI